ncbi:MAG: hypothetical protein WDM78_16810 [Puia sp.]
MVSGEKILFEGNNYSDEWEAEAKKRGLGNVKATPLALDALLTEKTKHLYESNNVLTHIDWKRAMK